MKATTFPDLTNAMFNQHDKLRVNARTDGGVLFSASQYNFSTGHLMTAKVVLDAEQMAHLAEVYAHQPVALATRKWTGD